MPELPKSNATLGDRVFALHRSGFPLDDIATELGVPEDDVRSAWAAFVYDSDPGVQYERLTGE